MKVPIQAIGGPYDGQIFQLEDPRPLVPDCSTDEAGWWTDDPTPQVTGRGYYQLHSPTAMHWVQNPDTP